MTTQSLTDDPADVITVEIDEGRSRPVCIAQGTYHRWITRMSWSAATDLHDQLGAAIAARRVQP